MAQRILLPWFLAVVAAGYTPTPDPAPLVVIDNAGKEQKLKSWTFTTGIRHLSWLAPEPTAPAAEKSGEEPKARVRAAPVGPEALEFREEESTPFVEGVLTFLLLDRLRSLEYDIDQKTVTARVATGPKPEDNEVLTGTTRFERVNKLAIEAEVDKGELGIAAVRYLGGSPRGMHGLRFPSPKPDKPPVGRPAMVATAGKMPSSHKVTDLQALYRLKSGHERLTPLLMFKKTLKLEVTKIQKITAAGADDDPGSWQVQLKSGSEETLTLLRVITLDGQDAQFEGLLGRVTGGYKLFPLLTIGEVVFDAAEVKPDAKSDK
jgi:hypothetical protein